MEYNRTSAVFATFSLCLYANMHEEKLKFYNWDSEISCIKTTRINKDNEYKLFFY